MRFTALDLRSVPEISVYAAHDSGKRQRDRFTQVAFALLFSTVLIRLMVSALLPLIPEEAYYWMYARHPSLSYHDHPPMVAWVIRLGIAIFGRNEWGVRVVGNAMAIASIAMMYAFTRLWLNRRAAIFAAGSLLIFPIYVWTGFICTMDSQLIFFWIMSLLGASIALRRATNLSWLGWYLAGVGLGGALLSKYTGIFVGAGIGLAVLIHPPWRRHLLTVHPWAAGMVGLALFSPVVLWNYRNHWASFRYQFVDREEQHPLKSWMTLWSTANFLLLQLAAVTPIFFAAFGQLFRRRRRWLARLLHRPLVVFSMATALPLLASMAWKSILFDVHFNWTAPGFLSLLPIFGATVAARWRLGRWNQRGCTKEQTRERKVWDRSIVVTVVGFALGNIGCLLYLVLVTPWTGRPEAFGSWPTLGRVVARYAADLQARTGREPLIIGRGKYHLASELAFYRSGYDRNDAAVRLTTSQCFFGDVEGLAYADWAADRPDWVGRDCIYVTDKDDIDRVVRSRFRATDFVNDPDLKAVVGGMTYHLAICYGFKG